MQVCKDIEISSFQSLSRYYIASLGEKHGRKNHSKIHQNSGSSPIVKLTVHENGTIRCLEILCWRSAATLDAYSRKSSCRRCQGLDVLLTFSYLLNRTTYHVCRNLFSKTTKILGYEDMRYGEAEGIWILLSGKVDRWFVSRPRVSAVTMVPRDVIIPVPGSRSPLSVHSHQLV